MHLWTVMVDRVGLLEMPYTGLLTLAELLFYQTLTFKVGQARGKYKVEAPSTDGPPAFQKLYRVHLNTLEQLAFHLPLLWLAAYSVGDLYAAIFGLIWPIGRLVYMRSYLKAPKTRTPGFAICMLSNVILLAGIVVGIIKAF